MLWAFDIEPTIDEATGKPIMPDSSVETGYREGLTLCAKDFSVRLTVRSAARRTAIEKSFKAAVTEIFDRYDNMGGDSS